MESIYNTEGLGAKAADIVGLNLEPPDCAVVNCVNEKPPLTSPATKANGGKNQPDGIVTARQQVTYHD